MRTSALCALLAGAASASAQAVPIPQGAEFSCAPFCTADIVGFGDGRAFADAYNTSVSAPVDANGWPLSDFMSVVFDLRPAFAWAPPEDDPWGWSAPLAGDYCFNFTGFATVAAQGDAGEAGVTVSNVTTDGASTAGVITIGPSSPDLLVLNFTSTRRTAAAAAGTGITGLRILVPGQCGAPAGSAEWAAPLLQLVQPFHHLRFMGITGTNSQAGYYGDAGHHYLEWTDRCLPSDAQWPSSVRAGCWGMPWEAVVGFAQASGKGIWVNLPVSATVYNPVNASSYAYQWAALFKSGNAATGGKGVPGPIYVEHSNEVWVRAEEQKRHARPPPRALRARAHAPTHIPFFSLLRILASRSTCGISSPQWTSAIRQHTRLAAYGTTTAAKTPRFGRSAATLARCTRSRAHLPPSLARRR